jgi:NAD(P)-dependent dehydrogenase (short-subunit alcohol dehydrogenase family)
MRFEHRVALATGVATGLGRAIAGLLAGEGARLVLVDIAADALTRLAETLRAKGASVATVVGDVARADVAQRAVQVARERFGRIDMLFNNAGVDPVGSVVDTSEATWDQVLDVNLKSAFLFCKAAIPVMIAGGGGAIVNTASIAGQRASSDEAAYSVSKAGLIMLTRTIARDFAKSGIRANVLCPGFLESVMTDRRARMSEADIAALAERAAQITPMGRVGRYEEVAKCAAFLASDDASYVNGSQLTVDGGMTA